MDQQHHQDESCSSCCSGSGSSSASESDSRSSSHSDHIEIKKENTLSHSLNDREPVPISENQFIPA